MQKYIKRLYIWFIVVIVFMAFMLSVQHIYIYKIITDNIKDMTDLSVDLLNKDINNWLSKKSQVIKDSRDFVSLDKFTDKETFEYFNFLIQKNNDFNTIYFGTPAGEMINGDGWIPPEDYDLTERPWYKKAVKKNKLIVTESLIDASTGKMIVTIASPVYSDKSGEFLGVVAGDVFIQKINTFFQNNQISKKGFTMLVDSNNSILANSKKNFNQENNLIKVNQKYNQKLNFIKNKDKKTKSVVINSKKGLLSYEPTQANDWYLVNFTPKSEYNEIFNKLLESTLLSFAFSLIIFIIFLFLQKKYVINPLKTFNNNIRKIDVEKNPDYRIPLDNNRDFSFLNKSINNLLNKIEDYVNELEDKNKYIKYLANHDPLTDLPNRRSFMNKLSKELEGGKKGAVMLLDLDNFKDINDTLGHTYGDMVLKEIAKNMKKMTDENVFVSRFGGDEFLVLIKNTNDIENINYYIDKVSNIFNTPFTIKNNTLYINFSMGISIYPYDSKDINQLVTNADTAMYRAKKTQKKEYKFFDKGMIKKLKQKNKIKDILRKALKNDGFKLKYQPQVDLKTGHACCYEALLRLENYDISPGEFIPVAEETGLIIDIGRWVVKKALKQLADFRIEGYQIETVAINFSAKQLNDDDFIDFIIAELNKNNIKPESLEIEITEGILLERKEKSISFLNELEKSGVNIALDDFGTGYSSLSYLTFIPVDKIKLDKSLMDTFVSKENISTIENLIGLVHSFNLEIIAEGVEEINKFEILKDKSCDYIQGYLFSKPLEVKEIKDIYNKDFLKDIGK